MRILLFIFAVLSLLSGVATFGVATSAIHEIEAYMQLLIAAVCLAGAGVIEAVNQLRKDVLSQQPAAQKE